MKNKCNEQDLVNRLALHADITQAEATRRIKKIGAEIWNALEIFDEVATPIGIFRKRWVKPRSGKTFGHEFHTEGRWKVTFTAKDSRVNHLNNNIAGGS